MNVLVCGGAGYIGSHLVRMLLEEGHRPLVFDDFSTGHKWLVEAAFRGAGQEPRYVEGSLLDAEAINKCLVDGRIDAVMHFAAKSQVKESMTKPGLYYHNNVNGTLNLLQELARTGVNRLIFSSTAAVYGLAEKTPILDDAPTRPINPYGRSKLMAEMMMADFAAAHGLKAVALRYFNVAGANPDGSLAEDHRPETHLIPLIIHSALGQSPRLKVFGHDYPTPDGTCIRDYVHVQDLASAHLAALSYLDRRESGFFESFNVGTGFGVSNLEVIKSVERVSGRKVPFDFDERRPGDPPVLYADASRAASVLNWRPHYTGMDDIVATAFKARKPR